MLGTYALLLLAASATFFRLGVALAASPSLTCGTVSDRSYAVAGSGIYSYLISVPRECATAANKSLPLILFLHGAGESGTGSAWGLLEGYDPVACAPGDTSRPIYPPLALALTNDSRTNGYFMLAPRTDQLLWNALPTQVPTVLQLVRDTIRQYPCISPDKVIVTGLSMGGEGTWAVAAASPASFAGFSPVSGYSLKPLTEAWALRSTPAYFAHEAQDPLVPVGITDNVMVPLLRVLGNTRVNQVIYSLVWSGNTHDAWDPCYRSDDWWNWVGSVVKYVSSRRPA
jgi:predicted peptidase